MTEKEAVENIKAYICKCNYTWTVKSIFNEYVKHLKGAYVSYTALDVIENCHMSLKQLSIKALEEIQQYRAIGWIPVEEAAELIDRDTAKEPIKNDLYYFCPNCKTRRSIRQKHDFCHDCGQRLKWED